LIKKRVNPGEQGGRGNVKVASASYLLIQSVEEKGKEKGEGGFRGQNVF